MARVTLLAAVLVRESSSMVLQSLRPVLDWTLASPLNELVLTPMARSMMIRTAEANSVPWREALAWAESLPVEWTTEGEVPAYYRAPFHAYPRGNMCKAAALEQEIASAAVGARNYPAFGRRGEAAFRGAFETALAELGATVPDGALVLDLGCGTGGSTRRLKTRQPSARVVGLDLSPYFVAVGRALRRADSSRWVNDDLDADVRLEVADIERLPYADASVDVCQLSLVVHELPPEVTKRALAEAARVLKPAGQLWLTEMDFDTPGFRGLRANPLLFAFIRSTEPYLDDYADYGAAGIIRDLLDLDLFSAVALRAATGRHFALLATRRPADPAAHPTLVDDRRAQTAMPDTHLPTWAAASPRSSRP